MAHAHHAMSHPLCASSASARLQIVRSTLRGMTQKAPTEVTRRDSWDDPRPDGHGQDGSNRSIIAHPRRRDILPRPDTIHPPPITRTMTVPQNPNDRSEITFRFLAEPAAVNFGGKVHGGSLMKWIDEVAYACAATWSGRYCVTVSVGNIRFRRPILVGNLVELRARIVATGRTSMHIHVSVHAGDPKWGELRQTTDCLMVFVAVDESNHPVSVPSFEPKTEEQKALAKYAMDVKAALDAIVELKPENVAG